MDLAEHGWLSNSGDYKSNWITANQIQWWFLVRGENRSTWGKTSRKRVENLQTQPMYDGQGIEPRPHPWKTSALTTAQTLLSFLRVDNNGDFLVFTGDASRSTTNTCWFSSVAIVGTKDANHQHLKALVMSFVLILASLVKTRHNKVTWRSW